MGRKYIKKLERKYEEFTLNIAVEAVRTGALTPFAAANQFQVLYTTLRRHMNG
jgi:hypothetical protein